MRSWTLPLLIALTLAGAGCPCSSTQGPVLGLDGGAVPCVAAEDCPRTGTDNVCVTNSPPDYTGTCVTCQSSQCVRVVVSCP
ncbi:MAG TPA: hypothetical protein VK454_12300 [Myxococcaceae bacterium]|nr:hypothetical protein [Myxococcaceae bacterium]